VKVRLTKLEYEELTKASKSSKCMSDYFRQRVFRKGVGLIDPKEFIRSMDEICLEMKRIGNSMKLLCLDRRISSTNRFHIGYII
jgi:hypothetical protein